MTGMTLKQMARKEFFKALDAYKAALKSKDSRAIVITSVRIHRALDVPKIYKSKG
jgi:hypothetical protein